MSRPADPVERPERFRMLFVCTGNTCRSPLAAAIARRLLEERGWPHVEVRSAGAAAGSGEPASGGARRAASRHGLDLADHRSRPLTAELVEWADLILAMSPHHVEAAGRLGGEDKAALLSAFAAGTESADMPGVPDPFGGTDEIYEDTFHVLSGLVEHSLARLEPILSP